MSPTNHFDDDGLRPWSLADIYADLGSRQDISKILDVTPFRVEKWLVRRERVKCPYPVRRIGGMDIYSMQEWRDWFEHWEKSHRRDTKWVEDAKPHGAGQSFFTYFTD